jgi:hypothetical protein
MTKKGFFTLCFWVIALAAAAQDHMPSRTYTYTDEGPGNGFLKENLFLGGGLDLGFGSHEFNVGVNPEIGYSLNRWLDAGVVVNFSYQSISADPSGYYNPNVSSKQFTYGAGVFGRAFVLPFLFLTAQPEYNWTSITQKDESYGATYKLNVSAPSLLLGIGYGQRIVGENNFYIALMFDALSNKNSPYNDIYGHPLPVLRAGFDFYLHSRK